MTASDIGSKDWWRVVQSMPQIEALQLLNDYKSELMLVAAGKPEYIMASAQISKVNAEIKRINIALNHSCWHDACKAVLPQELLDAVIAYRRQMEWKYRPVEKVKP